MKRFKVFCFALAIAALSCVDVQAQSRTAMSLNGATGLFSIPTGRIGWERSSSALGLDFGYHTIIADGNASAIPKAAMSLFNTLELSAAIDIQPESAFPLSGQGDRNVFIGGAKIQLPLTRTALAFGGNIQFVDMREEHSTTASQVYAAITYAGRLFDMPAETTVVFGRTFIEGRPNSNIDFGMGFDVQLFPRVFDNLIHWVTDFANFSYSVRPFRANAVDRGVLNTGIRLNLTAIPAFSRLRLAADIMLVDAFDENRAFSMGMTLGVPLH
ncbi:MAG: hypothetical protein FWC64_04710 [Treponema sp.]|nr:hypothetical protein [Treponema sp.]